MAEVQELIIKYRADVEELQGKVAQIESELRKVPQAANQAGAATTQAFKTTGTEAKKATTNVGDFSAKVKASVTNIKPISDQFANLGKSIVAAFAVERIIQFGFESVKAFQEAEKNAVKLQSAVSVNGGLQHDFDELIKQSNELQDITIFSDDDIQRAQTAALQFGLTREQVQKLIPAVTDFASATGQDLQSALEGILQGVNGSERALKKYGITVDENGTRTSRLSQITEQLNKKFEGQAEVIGKTAFGAAEKYKNELDDLQESLGSRLAPLLNDVRSQFLVFADGAITAGEGVRNFFDNVNDFFGGGADRIPQLIGEAGKANLQAIQQAKQAFESLSNSNISAKIEVFTQALVEAKEEAKGLNAQQAQAANQRITEYANQITALRLIQGERRRGISGIDEEAAALEKLKNISSLSDTELQQLSKTLAKFNDIKASDAIDLIQKELEARQKGTAKAIEDKKKGLDELNKLEQKASDRSLAIKAEEISKVEKLEQDKQKELRDLINAAGTASGANVEPIVLEFESTGKADIERTIELLKQAKFPQAEIDKFTLAVQRTNSAFDILIQKQEQASKELELKINAENIQSDFDDLQAQFETFQEREEILLQVKFIQAGDFSPEAIEKLDQQVIESRQRTNAELIEQAKKFGIAQADIDKLILQNKLANNEIEIEANKKKLAAILAGEEATAQKRKDLINEIRDTALEFATTLISDTIDKRAEADIAAVESTRDAEVAAIDDRIEKNDERHQKGIIGDREAEQNHERLLQEKKKADDRADNAERLIKRKQFRNDQLSSVAKVVIANTVNAAEFPALAGLYAGLAVAQSAIILSQPNPYKKGSKKTKPGLAIVGEEGPEFVMMPSAAKVLTAPKTKEYSPVIDAIMDDRFEEHIDKNYVQPAIKQEKIKREKKESKITESLESRSSEKVSSEKDSRVSKSLTESVKNVSDTSEVNKKKVNESLIDSKNITAKNVSRDILSETKSDKSDTKSTTQDSVNNIKSFSEIKSDLQKSFTENKSESTKSKRTEDVIESTERFSSIIEAMYAGKVDEYLRQSEVSKEVNKEVLFDSVINHRELNKILSGLQISPILKAAERSHEQKKQEDFAANITNSIILHGKGLTREDYYQVSNKNRRKGMPITNAHEIVEPIIEALKSSQSSPRRHGV